MKKYVIALAVFLVIVGGISLAKILYSVKSDAFFRSNVEALASGESETETWQEAEVTKTTVTCLIPGWTWDAEMNVWLFEGKVQSTVPPSTITETIKYKCCRRKGPLSSCVYEEC